MWAYNSIFYQIYPIGFCGAPVHNDGVCVPRIRKLMDWSEYLQTLGVDSILLNPIFESDNHGYDTRDFKTIDCRLGTNEDFKEVCENLHKHNVKIVLDGVFNHVGRGFWAFKDVQEKKWDSPYKDWFHISFDDNSCYNDGFWYEGWEGHFELVKLNLENKANDLEYRYVDSMPFVPSDDAKREERCKEIFAIQASGLAKRIEHVGSNGVVVGISGGLDSTLALLVSVQAMKLLGKSSSDILGVTMPGFGTTDRTYQNALELMKSLGVTIKEISIKDACILHMNDIEHDSRVKDITYENTQARERTQILFDLANKHGKLLVGTGDLSELAMGWCTYNGDHMSMYGVNASVPKTLVKYLVEYVARVSDKATADILYDVLDTPVSPELLPPDENGNIAQKTEDNIGPYELHDFFLYNFVRFGFSKEKIEKLALKAFGSKYDEAAIAKWLGVFTKRFFISQFKRSCIPDSPKVGSVSLSPRGDWRMPSDASFNMFI